MRLLAFSFLVLLSSIGFAQHEGMNMPQTPAEGDAAHSDHAEAAQDAQMSGMHHAGMSHQPGSLIQQTLHRATSGTSAEPNSTPMPMLMTRKGKWTIMFHANAFLNVQQQTGSRGSDKIFSTNWFMPMAQRDIGPGKLTLRFMGSLEPATITNRYYPELFQQGETAFGKPIVDGQHPHDFIMELAAIYDWRVREDTLLSFYVAPMGDPAMGPSAYPHRASASENPLAALGHHLQDSTHIAADVFTVGVTHKSVRLEASAFHGREPDEQRWNLHSGQIDSWSARLSVNPAENWSVQYSMAKLNSPESLHPEEDIRRMTGSVMYNRSLARGNWATTLLWGRNINLPDSLVWNSYLAESTLRFADKNYLWARVENVDRTSELLLGDQAELPGVHESIAGRVQAYTIGYDREFGSIPYLATALGGQVTWYGVPASLSEAYGNRPLGAVVFLRLRPFGREK